MPARQVSWDAQAADFKAAVETLSNVEEVEVTKEQWTDDTGYDFYRWTVRADGLQIVIWASFAAVVFYRLRPAWVSGADFVSRWRLFRRI